MSVPINQPDKVNTKSVAKYKFIPSNMKLTVVSEYPYIVTIENFVTNREIEALLGISDNFQPSTIVVDGKLAHSDMRTSNTLYITDNGQHQVDNKYIGKLLKRVCYLTSCYKHQIEGLMLVRYKKGQYYKPHHDYLESSYTDMLADGGQRIGTFFVYLNDVRGGGETSFPELGLEFKPKKGSAVFWWNVDDKIEPIPETLHQGKPVTSGIKFGLNIWIRYPGWYHCDGCPNCQGHGDGKKNGHGDGKNSQL